MKGHHESDTPKLTIEMDNEQEDVWNRTWLNSGKEINKKTSKIISEMKTKLQGTQGKIDITRSSVRDIKNRNEKVKKVKLK